MKAEIGLGLAVATATAAAGWYLRRKTEEQIPTDWIALGSVEELLIYPLKSGAAQLHKDVQCSPWGPLVGENRDRMLAIVREDGSLVTGRDFSKLVLVSASVDDELNIELSVDGREPFRVNLQDLSPHQSQSLRIWKSVTEGVDCGDAASAWLSNYLQTKVRLLFYPERESGKRMAKVFENLPFVRTGDGGKFSDATSFHLVNTKSVDDLNTRLDNAVDARNFRPNIIISGDKLLPYEEDSWDWVKVGDTIFRVVAPCTRCLFTTVNARTAEKSEKHEPLKTLQKYRGLRDPKKRQLFGLSPVMGIYLGLRGGSGSINVGDTIYVAVTKS